MRHHIYDHGSSEPTDRPITNPHYCCIIIVSSTARTSLLTLYYLLHTSNIYYHGHSRDLCIRVDILSPPIIGLSFKRLFYSPIADDEDGNIGIIAYKYVSLQSTNFEKNITVPNYYIRTQCHAIRTFWSLSPKNTWHLHWLLLGRWFFVVSCFSLLRSLYYARTVPFL